MLFKLDNKIFSVTPDGDFHMLAELDHLPEPTLDNMNPQPVVRCQSRNRRDEVVVVGGKPVRVSHGIYEFDQKLSERFRWFLDHFKEQLGIVDVNDEYNKTNNLGR